MALGAGLFTRRRWLTALAGFTFVGLAVVTAKACVLPPDDGPLTYYVIDVHPHDTSAFTQGLLWHDGKLYESTGLRGQSSLRRVDLETGAVEQRVDIPAPYFCEGLVLVDDRLIQLTWRENTAFVYDVDTFEQIGTYSYDTEGWGLTYDGERLIMSDGTATLYFRDPGTFELLDTVVVTENGVPITRLNELEYILGLVYANVWLTDDIVIIDPSTGEVTNRVDLAGLLPPEERTGEEDVLNGIAFNEEDARIYVTGKLWPTLYDIRLVPQPVMTP